MYIMHARGSVSFFYNILHQVRWGKVNFYERKKMSNSLTMQPRLLVDMVKYSKGRYFYLVCLIFLSA